MSMKFWGLQSIENYISLDNRQFYEIVLNDDDLIVDGKRYTYNDIVSIEDLCRYTNVSTIGHMSNAKDNVVSSHGSHVKHFIRITLSDGISHYVAPTYTRNVILSELNHRGVNVNSIYSDSDNAIKFNPVPIIGFFVVFIIIAIVFNIIIS